MIVTIDCRDIINCKVTIVLCNGVQIFIQNRTLMLNKWRVCFGKKPLTPFSKISNIRPPSYDTKVCLLNDILLITYTNETIWSYDQKYSGCPKKTERSIFVTLIFENIAYFDFIRWNIVFWKEWYQDYLIWFGSIDSTTISWTSIYNFCFICASYLRRV